MNDIIHLERRRFEGDELRFGVFTIRPNTQYEYEPFDRYHFRASHLSRVRPLRGQWILYYEPVSVRQSRGYFAMALVDDIVVDPRNPELRYALIVPGSYLDFADPVPFSDLDGIADRGVSGPNGKVAGGVRQTVREIASEDYKRIVRRGLGVGFDDFLDPKFEFQDGYSSAISVAGFSELQVPYDDAVRERVAFIGSRPVRASAFRTNVLRAYDSRCPISGFRLKVNGGGFEVEAAHIKPVDDAGPDVVCNGIALTATVHRLFDRRMISLSDNYKILISSRLEGVEKLRATFPEGGRMILPRRREDWPHPRFLQWHREHRFDH